jgi:hypothetical protein
MTIQTFNLLLFHQYLEIHIAKSCQYDILNMQPTILNKAQGICFLEAQLRAERGSYPLQLVCLVQIQSCRLQALAVPFCFYKGRQKWCPFFFLSLSASSTNERQIPLRAECLGERMKDIEIKTAKI